MDHQQVYTNKQPLFEKITPYNHSLAPLFIRDAIRSLIPEETQHIFVVCIGSSRISGDSLGPFVGTLLQQSYPNHLTVLGNLQNPYDAETLFPELTRISIPTGSFVIAVDSVIGSFDLMNTIVISDRSLRPGIGLGNILPLIGDCSIMGVTVDKDQSLESSLLYSNLHVIYKMASNIAKGISLAVRLYFRYPPSHPVLATI